MMVLCNSAIAQVLYLGPMCKDPCDKCNPQKAMKVEYKADSSKQIVMRIINDNDVDVVSDCKVLDKNNWVCDGYGVMNMYAKQYATNGVAYWNDGVPSSRELEMKYGKNYSCRWDKNIFGQFKLRK